MRTLQDGLEGRESSPWKLVETGPQRQELEEKKKDDYGQRNDTDWDEKSEVEQGMGLVVKEKRNIWEREAGLLTRILEGRD